MEELRNQNTLDMTSVREDLLNNAQQGPSFSKRLFGYSPEEVDEYIESLYKLLEGAKASFQAEFEQMRSQCSLMLREKESNEKYVDKLKSDLDRYKEYHEANTAKIRDLEQFIETLKTKEKEEEGIEELKERLDEMGLKISRLQDEVLEEKAQNAMLTREKETLALQVAQLEEQLEFERRQNENLSGNNEGLKNELLEMQKKLSQEETQNLNLSGQIESLTGSLKELIKENALLNERVSELNVKLQRERAAVEGSLYSYKQYQRERLEQLKLYLAQVGEVINEISTSYNKAESYVLANCEKADSLPDVNDGIN